MEKIEYHEPELRVHGNLTETTLDPSCDPLYMLDGDIDCGSW